jgi:hypothetical protein
MHLRKSPATRPPSHVGWNKCLCVAGPASGCLTAGMSIHYCRAAGPTETDGEVFCSAQKIILAPRTVHDVSGAYGFCYSKQIYLQCPFIQLFGIFGCSATSKV